MEVFNLKTLLLLCSFSFSLAGIAQENEGKKQKSVNITGLPIISYNSSYGVIVGVNGMAIFNLKKTDTISPPSQIGIRGIYTGNKSYFAGLFSQFYFKEDSWRTTLGGGFGDINFQYFEMGNGGDEGDFVDYSTTSSFLFVRGLRKVARHLYAGLFFKIQHSSTDFEDSLAKSQEVYVNGWGVNVLYDGRNNIFSPSSGLYSSISFTNNAAWLGTDSVFSSIRAFVNYYYGIGNHSVLAARASMFAALGNVPFSGQHAVGGKDIRGYSDGKYRGNQSYSLQAEYRWNFYRRWGAVGFMGMAFTLDPKSPVLPGGGLGLRFKAIQARNINVGVDYAIGNGDSGIYFRINEAF